MTGTPPRERSFADPRAWWACYPARDWPLALPAYLARAWRRLGRPVWRCTHEQACAMQRRLRERAAEAVAEPAKAAGEPQFGLFGTEAA